MKVNYIICLLLLLPFSGFCQSTNKSEIPFELLPSGHILVKATIDNVEGSFIFDTGAGITVFTKTFFKKLVHTTLEDGGYTAFRATGERVDIDLYRVANFELGSLKKVTEEISYIDADLGGIDGIISLKLLEYRPFTIDFEKKVLRLESPATLAMIKRAAKKLPIQLEQSREKSLTIFSYFKINDTLNLQLSLDAGAGKDVYRLNAKYLQALHVDISDTVQVKKIQKKSEMNEAFVSTIYITHLKSIVATGQPTIIVKDCPVQFVEGLIYDGIIWINWLGKRITFDLQDRILLVQR
jgi:Aspartyl protease